MISTAEFEKLYARLNESQREAVDTIEGTVMVIAGPGTGKTQVLTLRIANILLRTDAGPSAILALTFTNAAAANMRKRLVSIIGSAAYDVNIFTFHSFANYLIEQHPEYFPRIAGFQNASEIEQLDILQEGVDALSLTHLSLLNDRYAYVQDIRGGITHLKREGLSADAFTAWVQKERMQFDARTDLFHEKGAHKGKMKGEHQKTLKHIERNEELSEIYTFYEKALTERKRYDYDDALLAFIEALEKNEDFLREVQERYLYFLVDEHQDTNGAQNRILELLTTFFDTPNLFVVGDEKQAIFRFQGASMANFLYFEKKFRDVKRINLTANYRSHQGILDSAHSLIGHNAVGLSSELTSMQGAPEKIKVFSFGSDEEELLFLADSVRAKIADGVPPEEIAVLYRNNVDAGPVAEYFERLGIPFVIESGQGVFNDPDIKKLNYLLEAVADLSDNDAVAKTLFLDLFDVDVSDVHTVLSAAQRSGQDLYAVMQHAKKLELVDPAQLTHVLDLLKKWHKASINEPFARFFEQVVRESGILTHIQTSSSHTEKFDKLTRLLDEIKTQTQSNPEYALKDYVKMLTILKSHHVALDAKPRHVSGRVRLMTAHRAKGLEFAYVYIINAYDGHWGNKRNSSFFHLPYGGGTGEPIAKGGDIDDERRLFYVALTRAKLDATISYALHASDGRVRVPSQFIAEIQDEYKEVLERDGEKNIHPFSIAPVSGKAGKEKYADFVRAHFETRGLSATALNAYLTCPWKWFYRHFFRMQFVYTVSQMKGSAMHGALQNFFDTKNTDAHVGLDFLLNRLEYHLAQQAFTARERERVRLDARNALTGYFETYHSSWTLPTVNEFFIQGALLDGVRLTGKLDKLEVLPDGEHVNVIDYKTGKPKSRNHIEGKTKSPGAGDYKRQLVFYRILLERMHDPRYIMKEAVIDFVEPTESGSYKREAFVIEDTEVQELEADIRRIADEITHLSFWDMRCDDKACEECGLRDLLEG